MTLLQSLDVDVMGLDLHPPYEQRSDISRGDITGPCVGIGQYFDLVICREVLEHLTVSAISRAVTNLCWYSSRFVYGTTRLHDREDILSVDTHDQLDPTHISIVSKKFLRLLFILHGFTYRSELALLMDHRALGRTFVFERTS